MENESCYGGGDIAGAIFGTLLAVILVAVLLWWLYKKNYILKRKDPQLVTDDPEAIAKGGEYAFDNPAFKTDGGAMGNSATNGISSSAPNKTGSPLDPSWTANKQNTIEKRKTVDDSYVNVTTPRLVSLRGSDFTGLGVEVYGGLKEGIFVKKVMPQGPAAGIVNTGDRITSITIDFRHIVQEDAMTILSYASPYNVQLELVSGTKPVLPQTQSPKPGHQSLTHPLYRSSSQSDLNTIERNSRKKLFPSEDASPLKMDNRAASPCKLSLPTVHKENERETKKHSFKQQMREMIEEKFQTKHATTDVERKGSGAADEAGSKKSGHKFGIRVFPPSVNDKLFGSKSPTKIQADNENNSNIEKKESDDKKEENRSTPQQPPSPPVVKKRTKADHKLVPDVVGGQMVVPEGGDFQRQNSLTSSGIRRDAAGIPQEMPSFMMQAANAARDNRKSTNVVASGAVEDGKRKGKAPLRPPQNESELDESTVTIDTNLSSIDGSRTILNGSVDMPDTRTAHPRMNFSDNFAEEVLNCTIDSIHSIEQFNETGPSNSSTPKSERKKSSSLTESELMMRSTSPGAGENESDVEQEQRIRQPPTPPRREGNKIELNADDITVHRSSPSPAPDSSMEEMDDEQEETNRRTASLGDLSKLEPTGKTNQTATNSNTLERAQSLEITGDASVVTVVNGSAGGEPTGTGLDGARKRKISSEILLDGVVKDTNDGLNSLQRHRLKGASAWGNLEDAYNSGELLSNGGGTTEEEKQEELGQVTVKQNGYTELSTCKPIINQAIIVAEAPKARPEVSNLPETEREEHISLTTISMNFVPEQEPDTNIPDDVKVSRYPFGSLERPKSDVLKKLLGQKEELENTPSVFISADGGESVVSTIKIESQTERRSDVGEPISLTLINPVESDRTESGQPSPVFTSGTNGVSSINISSMDYGMMPTAGSITLNGGMTKFSLTADNIVTISTALDGGVGGTESQPSSIVMIDDEKLDFSLQTLDDFDDPMDAPPPMDFATDSVTEHSTEPEPVPTKLPLANGVPSEQPPQPPQRSSIALNRRDSNGGPMTNGTTGSFVTEITLKAPEPPTAAERLPPVPPPQQNGTGPSAPPVIASKPPIVTKKPPKPEAKPTTPPSRIPVERRMSSEHGTNGGSLIPRNAEIKFSTAPYESSPVAGTNKTPTRGVDQIRSTFERSNSKTEIPVLIRRTSIPSINLSPSASATGGSMSNLSTKASPSRIPVFSSNGTKMNGGSPPPTSQNGTTHTNGLYRSNSNSTIMNNNNNNHLVNNTKMAVSITSIKNQAKHPSGKF
ncbi:dual specificity protein kinase splA-like [Anopheles marshallii]|uniref:dual specificity protein kinase splA-like n=1 Tax=Anopheles marshallii TaxID=1521116 RepID=UPI00237BA9A8|nr:dual specificity protein kinase splA-like [Anopheles marshallii]